MKCNFVVESLILNLGPQPEKNEPARQEKFRIYSFFIKRTPAPMGCVHFVI